MSGGRVRECWRGETRQVRTCGKQRTGKILGKAEEFWKDLRKSRGILGIPCLLRFLEMCATRELGFLCTWKRTCQLSMGDTEPPWPSLLSVLFP